MTTLHEYASPGWLQAACDIVEKHFADAGADLDGISFVFGEEFIGVPERLNPTGAERVGWHVRIDNGIVTTAPVRPPADADSNNIADWEATEGLSHSVVDATDHVAAMALLATVAELEANGKLERIVRSEKPAALAVLLDSTDIHNAVVAITADRVVVA